MQRKMVRGTLKSGMIVEELKKVVQKALKQEAEVVFEHPENPEHGDYSTNVALALGQKTGQNPKELAEGILSKVKSQKSKIIDHIKVAGPGFLNFFLSQEYLFKELQKIVRQKEKYGKAKNQKKKVMVEFTDPNPFKEFHIGHLYSNIVGESLSRLFEATGAAVKRANYQGDVGLHVAKAIWGMTKALQYKMPRDSDSLIEKVRWLGMCYAAGAWEYEEGKQSKKEIVELNEKIFAQDKEIQKLYKKGKAWSLEYFETIYKRLGTKFDYYYFESEVGKTGLVLVQKGLEKGIFEKSQGAIIFPGEKYGLHSRVFINSQGLPTYEAKELGLAPTKYRDFKYDLSLIITGNEIIEYFKVLLVVLKEIEPKLAEKTRHISHGMVRLPVGKMSSRTGSVITAEQLIDEVKSRVRKIMESSGTGSEIPQREQGVTAEAIAVGTVKYALLHVRLGKDIIFDFEKSLSLQGDSGPYLQYTYARCKSILRQSKFNSKLNSIKFKLSGIKLSTEEERILRLLYRFPEVVKDAGEQFSPNLLCSFVFEVAQAYNNFYNTHRVLQAEDKATKQFRLLLTAATAQIIKNSLHLLGIKTLERM